MLTRVTPTHRPGQSEIPPMLVCSHTLVVLVVDQLVAVDRVIGLLRRRRANMRSFTLAPSNIAHVARLTAVVDDSQVAVDHLIEQIRKVIDVLEVILLSSGQVETQEQGSFGAPTDFAHSHYEQQYQKDTTLAPETVSLEVIDSAGKIYTFVGRLVEYGFREAVPPASYDGTLSRWEVGAD
jgi:acetolactate synthase-1/3 small subunit